MNRPEKFPAGSRSVNIIRGAVLLGLLALVVTCSFWPRPVVEDRPRGVDLLEPPPAWDGEALATFEARGIAPPRTLFTGEPAAPGPIDRNWMRDAIAEARPAPARLIDGAERSDYAAPELALRGIDVDAESFGVTLEEAATPAEAPRPDPLVMVVGGSDGAALEEMETGIVFDSGGEFDLAESAAEEDASPESASIPRPLVTRVAGAPRLGKILFQNAEGKYESLVPRALRLQILQDGPRARTVVDAVFSNPHDRRLEGTFYYPLPAAAAPAAFGMFAGTARVEEEAFGTGELLPPLPAGPGDGSDPAATLAALAPSTVPEAGTTAVEARVLVRDWGELQVARVVEQKRARQVYETIVRRNIDPALLEWSGGNTFRARVFPIEPRSVKRVVLVYEETLPMDGDRLRYTCRLPRRAELGAIQCRLMVRGADVALEAIAGRESPPRAPVTAGPWAIHDLAFTAGRDDAVDLALRHRTPRAQILETTAPGGLPGSAFYARLRPPLPARETSARTGRALFLVDTSLSGEDAPAGLAAEVLAKILETDPTIDEYAVLLFDLRPRWLHAAAWRRNDAPNRAVTLAELRRIYLEGATNFAAVLEELESQESWIGATRGGVHAFLLSDGFITWGQDHAGELVRRHPASAGLRWISYQFGDTAFNRDLFDALARASGGRTVSILTGEQVGAGARAHRQVAAALETVAVRGARGQDLVVAGDPRLLFAGQELVVAGRLPEAGAGAELVVEARVDGERVTWRHPLRGRGDSPLAGRAWAELQTGKLLALDDERLDRMVVALSQTFGLANRVASLLILESEKDYEEFAIEDERVDLDRLEELRAREEDQRLDRLQGIALDEVPASRRDAIALLGRLASAADLALGGQPLLDRPLAGGTDRVNAEAAYREARGKDRREVQVYDRVARSRALAGDTLGALRAYSSLVEAMPASAESSRLVGYASMALGQYGSAAELFERARLHRPFEPQAYLEEALALEAAGRWGEAARNLAIVLSREFPRHREEAVDVARSHYARLLLAGLARTGAEENGSGERDLLLAELDSLGLERGKLAATGFQLTMHWNTDSTDIDLWVLEPEGERCYYENTTTAAGGRLFHDVTDGYGPELYQRSGAAGGTFETLAHYYGNNSARWSVPTAVLLVRDRHPFGGERNRLFQLRLLAEEESVVALRSDRF